ncbi:hypothetical protein ACGFYQ_35380 [Streptomyces sp. NPDC048258]|uniref:protein kinase domain-containing protein n=1 Tax=Streptomyces sp. NPDC048258 TaxID=3365527 RepID=UPI00371F1700
MSTNSRAEPGAESRPAESTRPSTCMVVGPLGYIAPERFSSGTVGPASDLWSLGATLYYAAEGQRAYRADEDVGPHIARLIMGEGPQIEKAGSLGPVVSGLTHKDPARRLDCDQARQALTGTTVEPARILPPVRRWAGTYVVTFGRCRQ